MTNDFDSKNSDMWPIWLTLKEVAQVLRYKDQGTVRLLTDKAVSLGGLRRLSDLVRETGAFEVVQQPGGGMRVRLKPEPAKPPINKGRGRKAPSSSTAG